MNLSAISNKHLFGKILRLPLKFIPKNAIFPILQGKLRGKKWIVGSSNHGCWLGSYEYKKRKIFEKLVSKGNIVFDLGAHVGFYTLLSSVLVGKNGKVFAFEPNPENLIYLKKHLKINNCKNVEVVEAAVLDKEGEFLFEKGNCSSEGKISSSGELKVKGIYLDKFVSEKKVNPDCLKIDIEGSEFLALKGAEKTLTNFHPIIFLSTHGKENSLKCSKFLKSLGYSKQIIDVGEEIWKI